MRPARLRTTCRMPHQAEPLRFLLIAAALALVGILFVRLVWPFLEAVVWALIVVLMTWPCYRRAQRLVPRSSTFAALTMTGVIALAFMLLVFPLAFELGREVHGALRLADATDLSALTGRLSGVPLIGEAAVAAFAGVHERLRRGEFLPGGERLLSLVAEGIHGFGVGAATLGLALFFCFFLYRDGPVLARQLKRAIGHTAGRRGLRFLGTTVTTLRGSVYGTLVTALAQGLLAGIGYWFSGAPTPVLLGLATCLFSFIPFGAPMVYLPVSLYLWLLTGSLQCGLLLALWGAAFVSTADNVLRPYFISHATRMPLPFVFVGVVGGVLSFGMLGVFVGPVVVALVLSMWTSYIRFIALTGRSSRRLRVASPAR